MKRVSLNRSGFTLIELMVVIAIIAILATGGINVYTTQLQGARDTARLTDMRMYTNAVTQYFSDEDFYPNATTRVQFITQIWDYISVPRYDSKSGQILCVKSSTTTSDISCDYAYIFGTDDNDLPDSAFVFAIPFEKKQNVTKSAMTDNGSLLSYFESGGGKGWEILAAGGEAAAGLDFSALTNAGVGLRNAQGFLVK